MVKGTGIGLLKHVLLVACVSVIDGQGEGYGAETVTYDGYGAAQDGAQDTAYEEVPYQAPSYKASPSKVIEVINRPSTCSCNRDAPCFDRKANKCVKAICDGRPQTLRHKGVSSPTIRVISDKKDPNAIIIGVSMLGLDVVDDDPEGVAGMSTNDEAAESYSGLGYGPSEWEKETCFPCRCPAYTHRCQDFNELGKWGSVCIFLEFILFFGISCLFLYKAWINNGFSTRLWIAVAGVIVIIGSLTAFIIMTGGGMDVRCWDNRHYYWIRYVGYMLMAPQCLWIITAVARGGGPESEDHPFSVENPINFEFIINGNLVLLAVASILMFASWMAGAFLETSDKWGYWVFGVVCLLLLALVLKKSAPVVRNVLPYTVLSNICIFSWSCIALLWIFDEGLGWVSIDAQIITLFVIDFIWVLVFGLMAVLVPWGQTKP